MGATLEVNEVIQWSAGKEEGTDLEHRVLSVDGNSVKVGIFLRKLMEDMSVGEKQVKVKTIPLKEALEKRERHLYIRNKEKAKQRRLVNPNRNTNNLDQKLLHHYRR